MRFRATAAAVGVAAATLAHAYLPKTTYRLDAPITRWDEAAPLGNGLLGGLLWGENNVVKLSLDRGDLWDLRPAPELSDPGWNYANLQKLIKDRNQSEISRLFDNCYEGHPYPTKLPGGRLEIVLPENAKLDRFELDFGSAEGSAWYGAQRVRVFFDANSPTVLIRVPATTAQFKLSPSEAMSKLDVDVARVYEIENGLRFNQRAASGLVFSGMIVWKVIGNETIAALTLVSNRGGGDLSSLAELRLREKLDEGYTATLTKHAAWWKKFWDASGVTLSDERVQSHYDFCKYLYGSGSRRGAPPMPLQGVWTADGGLPPWKGDYHNDLNTQTTYIAYATAGLFDSGQSWLEFNQKLLPRYKRFGKEFYGVNGAVVPGVMALDGTPLGGWGQYSLSPTNGAWIVSNFAKHWKIRRDVTELKKQIYPWCREIGFGLVGILKQDANGKLKLPLSSSPEIHDNSLRAWLKPNSNYDLALLKDLFANLADMASAVNQIGEASFWFDKLDRLDDFTTDETGLIFSEGEPVKGSHRHFSHLMAIHPLDVFNLDKPADRALATKSVDHMIKQGSDWWTGYSFSWMSCMLARLGDAERANDMLQKYLKGFILRNGFHCNGDQSGTGMSKFTYRPFTLEGNFLAMEAVQEMLLLGRNGYVQVFPATPAAWTEASFTDLRANGGFKVSAERVQGSVKSVRVVATVDAELRLVDPFGGVGKAVWTGASFNRSGRFVVARLKAGEGIRGEANATESN